MQATIGRALNTIPDALDMQDADERTCCTAASCLGVCYTIDVCCAIPTMAETEEGFNKWSLPLFAFYECCWPCMSLLKIVGVDAATRHSVRERFWPPDYINPHKQIEIIPSSFAGAY